MNIINYTRYNTGDLQDIVHRIESHPNFGGWRIPADRPLTVSEFDPKNPYISTRSSRWNKNEKLKKRYIAKGAWGAPHLMSLITPRKMYENPLEDLASAAEDEGEKTVPVEMLNAVIVAFQERLTYPGNVNVRVNPSGLQIRVNKKPAEKKPKQLTASVERRNNYAVANVKSVRWEAERALRELHGRAKKHFPVAETHLKEDRYRIDPLRQAVQEAEAAISRAVTLMRNLEASL
jgi:hypothetical protein